MPPVAWLPSPPGPLPVPYDDAELGERGSWQCRWLLTDPAPSRATGATFAGTFISSLGRESSCSAAGVVRAEARQSCRDPEAASPATPSFTWCYTLVHHLHCGVQVTSRSHALLAVGLSLAACGGDPDAGHDPWRPESWPDGVADPIAAGARAFDLIEGEWRLDLSAWPPDTYCEALDCPGPADGYDPGFAEQGLDAYDVLMYWSTARRSRLWRTFETFKSVVDRSTGLGSYGGENVRLYRRAIDGDLVAARGSTDPETVNGPSDFWKLSFADHEDRIQLVVEDPFTDVPSLKIEVQTAPSAVVVETWLNGYRAPKVADTVAELDSLPEEFADLREEPGAARVIELIDLALQQRAADDDLVAEILVRLGDEDTAVRLAAADYQLAAYEWPHNGVYRVIVLDHLLARLSTDGAPEVRATIAEGFRRLWTTVPELYFHCSLQRGLEQCVGNETTPEIATTCQAVLDLGREPYGYCPWIAGAP